MRKWAWARASTLILPLLFILWRERGKDRWRKKGSRNWSWAAILKAVTRRGYMVCHAIRMNPKRSTRCRVTSRRYEMRLPFFIRFGMNLHLVGWIGFEPIKERYGHGITIPHSHSQSPFLSVITWIFVYNILVKVFLFYFIYFLCH